MSHDSDIRDAFSAQADSFAAAAVANADELLDDLIGLTNARGDQHWLDAACGPGIITRRLAPRVATVEGVDLTPAMVTRARTDAAEAGLDNVTFTVGDVGDLDRPDGHYHGAVTRFSVHHLAVPGRMLRELARVVRPGGPIVIADHLADDDADTAIWSQSIERLRDPSHWSCRTAAGMVELARQAGLALTTAHTRPVAMDFADWLTRGGAGPTARDQIEQLLAERPAGTEHFRVTTEPTGAVLHLTMWLGVFTRKKM